MRVLCQALDVSALRDEEDAISCLQPCFYVLQRSSLPFTHLLFSLRLHLTVSLACVYTGRQLVQKQASCPPPQTQRWRNWTLSTLSSFSSILNVSTDRQASRRLLQRSTSPPRTHFHPHTLIYPRSWFLISRGSSSLTLFLKMELKYKLAFYFERFLMNYLNKRPQRDGAFTSNYRSAHVQLAAALVWPLCSCLQTAAWRWKTCWGNLIKTAGWPSTDMERWGGSEGTARPAALALDSLMLMLQEEQNDRSCLVWNGAMIHVSCQLLIIPSSLIRIPTYRSCR